MRPSFVPLLARLFVVWLIVGLAGALVGCSHERAPSGAASASASAEDGAHGAIARTVAMAVAVDGVDSAVREVRRALDGAGGFVGDATVRGEGDGRAAHLEVKVPAASLDAFRAVVARLGDVEGDTERAVLVGDQQRDLGARLRNARAAEARIVELTQHRASTMAEVLETEKELARVREGIEKMETEERALAERVAFATVTLDLTTRTVPAWKTPGASLVRAAHAGFEACAVFGVYGAMAAASVLPTALVLGAMAFVLFVIARQARRAAGRRAVG
jgi:hypothetical protein